jgi:hypothetical protein
MRPVTLGDLAAAARVLLAQPEALRPAAMAALIARAEAADRLRQAEGRHHPLYGNGTLMAAALAHPQAGAPPPVGEDFLSCLALATEAALIHARRAGKSANKAYLGGTTPP